MPAAGYSARLWTVTFAGVRLQGLADDNAFEFSYDEDGYTITNGLDGFTTVSENGASVLNVKVRLVSTSPFNGVLTKFYNLQRTNPINFLKPFSAIDAGGTEKIVSPEAMILKIANESVSKTAPVREWDIKVFNPVHTGGGSVVALV